MLVMIIKVERTEHNHIEEWMKISAFTHIQGTGITFKIF